MIDAIAHALIHSLWQGLVIAALLMLALQLLQTSHARYAASCLAFLLMLAAPVCTFVRYYQAPLAPATLHRPSPSGANVGNLLTIALGPSSDRFLPWLTAAWFLGVVLLSARWVVSWLWLQFRVRSARALAAPQIISAIAALRARMDVSRDVLVRSCDWLASPAITGWLRPTLLLPASALTGLSPDQLEALLAHELAHVRRYDYLANLIQTAVETLLFYHPAVWWVSGRIRAERENCCDDLAVSVCRDRVTYASALVALEEMRSAPSAMALAASGASLKARIRRILYPQQSPTTGWPAAALIALLMALFLWNTPRIAAQSSNLLPRHDKWLNETVVYIIQPDERTAFLKLTTDAERDHFIDQFWQRRNPNPGDHLHNAFMDEHYRRIAYANERFADPVVPGWKTDRGHIYIVYGPPDEIEIHSDTHLEQWLYHHIQGVGDRVIIDFVNGQMTKDPNPQSGRYVR